MRRLQIYIIITQTSDWYPHQSRRAICKQTGSERDPTRFPQGRNQDFYCGGVKPPRRREQEPKASRPRRRCEVEVP